MSKKFNLLSLHLPVDIHPRSWICFKGPKLGTFIRKLEKNILENQQWCRESLSKEIGRRLNCAHTTIKWILQRKREFYPIPVILELLRFSRKRKQFLKQFKENIEYLKVNSASAKPVRAVYEININLAKILGAFMADGSLSVQKVIAAPKRRELEEINQKLIRLKIPYSKGYVPSRKQYYISVQLNKNNLGGLNQLIRSFSLTSQSHYSVELTDEYKDSVEAFLDWVKEEFEISPVIFRRRKKAWRAIFSNKILARYLMCFFEVKPGPKAYDAFEPRIIQRSNLKLRKGFVKGVLMFDGCITKERKILFSSVSRNLFSSIKQIWKKDNIQFGESVQQRKTGYSKMNQIFFVLFTTAQNKKAKILEYFEKNTQKWKLLNWLSGNLAHTPVLKQQFSLSTEKILKVLQEIKCCDAVFLKNYFGCSYTTIRTYLKILNDQGKINLSSQPDRISKHLGKNTAVLLSNKMHNTIFKRIREKFREDKNFAKFLGIHKANVSAWRVRKTRIPVHILKEICKVLNLNLNEVCRNIEKTDREIAEII